MQPNKGSLVNLTFVIGMVSVFLSSLPGAQASPADQYFIATAAGGAPPPTPMPAANASVSLTEGVATDAAGNTYFSSVLSCVFKVDTHGMLTRVAGTCRTGYSGDGGQATSAQLNGGDGLAVDAVGNLYIADGSNQRIRKVSTDGMITTVAGNGSYGYSGDGGPATSAQLAYPTGVAVDAAGNLYISDNGNQRIRKVTANGTITTVAGNGSSGYSGDGGTATSAQLGAPMNVALDAAGNLFIAEWTNYRVRKVSNGIITTVAGNGTSGFSGDGGPAVNAELGLPWGITVDFSGSLYIADGQNHRIRMVAPNGTISTVAGNGTYGYSGDGGPAAGAQLYSPHGVAVDGAGNLYISDLGNHRIREVLLNGTILTIAGGGEGFLNEGGFAVDAQMQGPSGVAVDTNGAFYIADAYDNRVRKVSANGAITTVAGNGVPGFEGDGGAATSASLWAPTGVAVDSAGNLFIADQGNHRVREVSPSGLIHTVAGTGIAGYSGDGGPATGTQLNFPTGVAIDSFGNIFIADQNNHRIRKVTNGIITTVAGNGTPGYSGDGAAATAAQIDSPLGVAVDPALNLYIVNGYCACVRSVSPNGMIATVAGTGTAGFSGDGGPAISAQLYFPDGVAVDAAGNLYVSDRNNSRIRKVSRGIIATIAGKGGYGGYSGDGGPATNAEFYNLAGLSVDSAGNVYLADSSNQAIRLLQPASGQPFLSVTKVHSGSFTQGQNGATYSVTVSNAIGAGTTTEIGRAHV